MNDCSSDVCSSDLPDFWETTGERIARRNLYISIPALLLAFSVWMVWSMVVAKLPSIGFAYTTDQLFWLAALPGLSGATLRIFYSFMVPIRSEEHTSELQSLMRISYAVFCLKRKQ